MTVRIGINGFGRMGRLVLRAGWQSSGLSFVHVNETKGGVAAATHLLKFDSVHGRWPPDVREEAKQICIDGHRLSFSECAAPGDVAWDDLGVDVVLECSGKFRTAEALAPYFKRGVRKVIVAAPVKEGALNVVVGVNDDQYRPDTHHLLTAASCTTNCLAPIVKVIHEGLGIVHGVITTVHDMTNTQTIVDAPHKDLRRARAASLSLIPTSTGSATAIGLIYPELNSRLNGIAVRVPLLNASLTDCVFEVGRATSVKEVNGLLQAAAEGPLKGILGYDRDLDPLVDRVSELLALTPEERAQFVESDQSSSRPASIGSRRLFEYERANARVLEIRARRAARAESATHSTAVATTSPDKTASSASDTIVSTWMIAPLIFLFLLADTGSIKRGLLRAVPNRLFEPALAVLADVDEALGNYVRGMFLECCLLGVTVIVFIAIVGVPLRWAIAIGIFTGASNMVPYMGFAAALLSGLAYALLAENVHPILPFVTVDTFVIWVVVAVAVAELIKNVVYGPIVLGGAVKLHPIIVALGVVGAAILFGPAGMFLAIPTITVARVLATSGARHLTAYGVI